MNTLQRFFFRAPIGLYRVGLGGLLGSRFLLLEHRGRTSGELRQVVLEVLETDDDGNPVIASGFGEGSQWFKNVTADPNVWVTRTRTRTAATANRLDDGDALAVFERYRVDHPRAAKALGGRLDVSLVDDLDRGGRCDPTVPPDAANGGLTATVVPDQAPSISTRLRPANFAR